MTANDSASRAKERFSADDKAGRYPAAYRDKHRDRCERRALDRALSALPAGASVLDLPCGTGRLTGLLLERGYKVTLADSSTAMVERARALWASRAPGLAFDVQDVLGTTYADGQFDAVVCNRLFHHFVEGGVRRAALAELRRVARGPLVVSYFDLASVGAWLRRIRYGLRRRVMTDRVAIARSEFEADCAAAGLRIERVERPRPLLSQQTFAVIVRR